jgi:hypothetical protein
LRERFAERDHIFHRHACALREILQHPMRPVAKLQPAAAQTQHDITASLGAKEKKQLSVLLKKMLDAHESHELEPDVKLMDGLSSKHFPLYPSDQRRTHRAA